MSAEHAVAEEEVTADHADPATDESPREKWTLPGSPRVWRFGAGAFALAALVVAIVFGILWLVAEMNGDRDLASARDDVVKQGTAAVLAYTEVDYQHVDDYFTRVKEVSNDDMAKQITNAEPTYKKALTDQQTKVTTTVQDIAVEELNEHDGKASFLAAITTNSTAGGKTGTKVLRLEVQMTRVGSDWKLSGIDSVPLVAAGQ
ncbi:hypothetical protein [Amycolatopsis benzoatilytica]|uniref:hypothetical protein n=1 Tax=Amycolatopsis benzoatilytica TaxID=346045 RepID=UPI00035FA7B2|nr:hypothetical protein [Amycolatopsis benzoatilytica]